MTTMRKKPSEKLAAGMRLLIKIEELRKKNAKRNKQKIKNRKSWGLPNLFIALKLCDYIQFYFSVSPKFSRAYSMHWITTRLKDILFLFASS